MTGSRFRLATSPDPDDEGVPPLRAFAYDQLPLVILLVGDLTGRADPRPLEDRKPLRLDRANIDKCLMDQRIRLECVLPLPGTPKVTLALRRLDDFAPEGLAAQLVAATPLAGDELELALGSVYADPRLQGLERTWRSLALVVGEASDPNVIVEVVNASFEDLVEDLEDSRTLRHSGLWRWTHSYNSLGMRPYAAVVLDVALDASPELARALGEVASLTPLPILANATTGSGPLPGMPWPADEAMRFLGACAPEVALRRADTYPGLLRGSPSFAAAALLVRSFSRFLVGSGFTGEDNALPGVAVDPRFEAARARALGERGTLAFAFGPDGAWLPTDRAADGGSLDDVFLLTRLAHQVLHIQYRKSLVAATNEELVERINAGLKTRLSSFPHLSASISEIVRHGDAHYPEVELTLTVRVATPSPRELRHRFRMNLWR